MNCMGLNYDESYGLVLVTADYFDASLRFFWEILMLMLLLVRLNCKA